MPKNVAQVSDPRQHRSFANVSFDGFESNAFDMKGNAEHPLHLVVKGVSATFGINYPNSSTCSWNAVAISACAQNRW
ncbi:hypothetical protein GCM10009634_42000 [Saccharothrix xinjiangensis]